MDSILNGISQYLTDHADHIYIHHYTYATPPHIVVRTHKSVKQTAIIVSGTDIILQTTNHHFDPTKVNATAYTVTIGPGNPRKPSYRVIQTTDPLLLSRIKAHVRKHHKRPRKPTKTGNNQPPVKL